MKDKTPELMYRIGMLQSEMENLSSDHNFLNIKDEKTRLKYLRDIISNCESRSKQYGEKLNLNEHNTMKKSELKALLRVITEEVVAVKRARLNESKGLSGMKKAKESTEHTETIADSKDLTGPGPKENTEGAALPKKSKPANPKVGIKEDIMEMIREAIEEYGLEEMAKKPVEYDKENNRLKGSISVDKRKEDPSSPTGYSLSEPYTLKDGTVVPAGTPVDAPKGPYVPVGKNPNMGRPKKSTDTGSAETSDEDDEGDEDEDIPQQIKDRLAKADLPPSSVIVKLDGKSVGKFDFRTARDRKISSDTMATHLYRIPQLMNYTFNDSVKEKFDALSDLFSFDKLPSTATLNLKKQGNEIVAS
jgi:hypothetical protein